MNQQPADANRLIALQSAVAHHGPVAAGDATAVISTANFFLAFLTPGADAQTGTAETAAPATRGRKTTAAKTTEGANQQTAQPPTPPVPTTTADDVQKAIASLLAANQRPKAAELFAKFGAKSFSGLKPADYAAFVKEAADIVTAAQAETDLSA